MDFNFEESPVASRGLSGATRMSSSHGAPRRVSISTSSAPVIPVRSSFGVGPFVLLILALLFGGVGFGIGTLMNGVFDVVYPAAFDRSSAQPEKIRVKAYDFSI